MTDHAREAAEKIIPYLTGEHRRLQDVPLVYEVIQSAIDAACAELVDKAKATSRRVQELEDIIPRPKDW